MNALAPPESLEVLLARAAGLAGRTLGELGNPRLTPHADATNLRHAKGVQGQLIEEALGAHAASKDVPDFPDLGVELKTLPVSPDGVVQEATYVCKVSFSDIAEERWLQSRVQRKLRCVLFVPVESDKALPLGRRRIGSPCLFKLEGDVEALLREDWELLAGKLATGEAASLTSQHGVALHIRPKARHSRERALSPAADGGSALANPKGFYLRPQFTTAILAANKMWTPER